MCKFLPRHIVILTYSHQDIAWSKRRWYYEGALYIITCEIYKLVCQLHNTVATCLIRTPLRLKNLFSLDRCLLYTGSNYVDI